MTNKVLFCATVDYHLKAFHLPYMKWFQEQEWEVHVAANGDVQLPYANRKFKIPIQRSPFDLKNIKAYHQLKEIIDSNHYGIIHCHTPMGGLLARLASFDARKHGTKVIYTAHGFHFCKEAPFLNWLVYYPIERVLAHGTDCLITINQEDYARAVNHRFKASRIERIHGVGVDIERFKPGSAEYKRKLRQKYGYQPEDFLLFYAAEFNKNKNQQFLIRMLAQLKKTVPNAYLLLAGQGSQIDHCRELAQELGVAEMVRFLGFRKDIDELLPMCDLAVASSFREGLPVNIMEAMACGLPVVATDNRGHRELLCNIKDGWLISPKNLNAMSEKIELIAKARTLRRKLGSMGRGEVERRYAVARVLAEMSVIYSTFMETVGEIDGLPYQSVAGSGKHEPWRC